MPHNFEEARIRLGKSMRISKSRRVDSPRVLLPPIEVIPRRFRFEFLLETMEGSEIEECWASAIPVVAIQLPF